MVISLVFLSDQFIFSKIDSKLKKDLAWTKSNVCDFKVRKYKCLKYKQ